jgi:hypothetical protein
MATSTAKDARCATCGKAASTFTCRGCSKDFCLRHTNEHRQELTKHMDEDIIPFHNQLRQNLDDQIAKPDHHLLMKQIAQWEQGSIEKIHQAADDARKQLLNLISKHTNQMMETLKHVAEQLKNARGDDHFFETDLKEWMIKLEKLEKDMITPQTIKIQYDTNTNSFISKILINETTDTLEEFFEPYLGNILITNDRTVIIHNHTNRYASVSGHREYSSGEHRLRFKIENLSARKWIFLGIKSKNAPAQTSLSGGKTGYGFSGADNVWRDGSFTTGLDGYRSDFEINDIIELIINCDQQKIRLVNERTRRIHVLEVNIDKCPFPWKLMVGLFYSSGERIRILSSTQVL